MWVHDFWPLSEVLPSHVVRLIQIQRKVSRLLTPLLLFVHPVGTHRSPSAYLFSAKVATCAAALQSEELSFDPGELKRPTRARTECLVPGGTVVAGELAGVVAGVVGGEQPQAQAQADRKRMVGWGKFGVAVY